jgi:hypothetical protein
MDRAHGNLGQSDLKANRIRENGGNKSRSSAIWCFGGDLGFKEIGDDF